MQLAVMAGAKAIFAPKAAKAATAAVAYVEAMAELAAAAAIATASGANLAPINVQPCPRSFAKNYFSNSFHFSSQAANP